MEKVTRFNPYGSTAVKFGRACVGIFLLWLAGMSLANAEDDIRVVIADPYIELHTGPGSGYPIYHVVDRHDWVVILKRKHDWFKVRSSDDKVGWVLIDQMEQTLTAPGVYAQFEKVVEQHFGQRSYELGVMGGDFEGAPLLTFYGGYNFNANLSTDHFVTQVSGDFTQTLMIGFGLMSTPFPEWWFSPYFSLGGGYIRNAPRKSFVFADETSDLFAYAGVGARLYLSRRLFMRLEVRQDIVFVDDDSSGDFVEVKGGFSFFF